MRTVPHLAHRRLPPESRDSSPPTALPRLASVEYRRPSFLTLEAAWPVPFERDTEPAEERRPIPTLSRSRRRSRGRGAPSTPASASCRPVQDFRAHAPMTRCVFASGQRRKAVPTNTALAPSVSAAATPRPSPIPPAAMIGTVRRLARYGMSAISPIDCRSAAPSSNAPRCPPASYPCAMIASAPAACACSASANVVAVANHGTPADFKRRTKRAGNTPMIDDTAVGFMSRNTSHCASKSGRTTSPADAGTSGPQAPRNFRTCASASASRLGDGSGIHVLS